MAWNTVDKVKKLYSIETPTSTNTGGSINMDTLGGISKWRNPQVYMTMSGFPLSNTLNKLKMTANIQNNNINWSNYATRKNSNVYGDYIMWERWDTDYIKRRDFNLNKNCYKVTYTLYVYLKTTKLWSGNLKLSDSGLGGTITFNRYSWDSFWDNLEGLANVAEAFVTVTVTSDVEKPCHVAIDYSFLSGNGVYEAYIKLQDVVYSEVTTEEVNEPINFTMIVQESSK